MRIVSFGSCLSRYAVNQYVQLFGGRLEACVYHNRSDAFVGRFVERDWPELDFESLRGALLPDAEEARLILENQCRGGLGRHRLNSGTPLLDLADRGGVDLIVLDNYMDLSARLLEHADQTRVFLRPADLGAHASAQWLAGDLIEVEAAVRCMQQIARWLRERFRDAALVFLCFPHNTYQAAPLRVERSRRYQDLLRLDDALIVPCLTVPLRYQTPQRQHFKSGQYAAYAGIIYQYLRTGAAT